MKTEKTSKNAAYTGLFAAVAASSCCIPPVIALIAGVGGSASALSWMEPFRPYLIGLAIVAIGYAWYNYLKPKKTNFTEHLKNFLWKENFQKTLDLINKNYSK